MAFAETQKLTVKLDLEGNFQSKLSSAARAFQNFDRATSNTQRSLSKFGRNIERGIVVGTGAAVAGFVSVAKAAGDFEAQMNTIATIVDRKDLPAIGSQLRQIAKDTGVSLDDLTSAYYDLASAGVKGKLASEALSDAVKLGIGGLATTAETVDLLTTAINAYGLDSKGAAKATDQFAQAVADGKVKASEIAATFADVASVAKQSGIGIDQIAASYAYLTAQGVPASEVTTEMQRAIISLLSPSKALAKAGKDLGVNWEQEIRKKGLVPALQEIATYAAKNKIPLIDMFGRIEAVKYALQTTGGNLKGFEAELDKMGKVSGVAAAQMAERQQGLNFQLNRLKALAKDAAITIGSALLPKLTPLVAKLNDFISKNQDKIADFGTKLADGFTKLADAVQKVDWQPFIDGLKLSGDIAKSVISAFRSLPADLQTLVVAGFALNKVTGGLGTSLVKDLGGALIGNLAQRGSTPANPLFVVDVTGGIGGLGGAGGAVAGAAGGLGIGTIGVGLAAGTAVAAIGLMGLGWLINATSSPEQIATTAQNVLNDQRFKRSGGKLGPIGTPSDPIAVTAKVTEGGFDPRIAQDLNIVAGGFDKRLAPDPNITSGGFDKRFADFTAKFATLGQKLANSIAFLHNAELHKIVEALRSAKGDDAIRKALKDAMSTIFTKGLGGSGGAKNTLAGLKDALKHTHDPQLQRELREAIAKVERKVTGREWVERQLHKADQIIRSEHSTRSKIGDLQKVEQALKDRGLPAAANRIRAKIDEEKRKLATETALVKAAVVAKKLAVTFAPTINTNVRVSSRETSKTQTTYKKYFTTVS